ncbi:MAG: class I SAM-dependent methyltransferase [Cyclobacteriaceae bacterium]|nr:class I SAM-dependent methyltransferase [Cyclobacteriaceae bacterium]
MTALAKGFDRLAPIYDSLAQLVIGQGIRTSQLFFLHHLAQKQNLLILGGGTGWILPTIFKINPTLQIDYVELSPKMLAKARLNAGGNRNVRFIEGTERNIGNSKYDCVITNFYLDLFNNEQLYPVVNQVKESLQPKASWLATDFSSERKWHKVILWIMYRFFSLATGLTTSSLPKWEEGLKRAGGKLVETRKSKAGFIKSVVFDF